MNDGWEKGSAARSAGNRALCHARRVIFFFGTRLRTRELGSGTFHCPFCFQPRTYRHLETRTWIHVFWIPLIPLGGGQEEVQCTVCGGRWAPAVLHAEPLA